MRVSRGNYRGLKLESLESYETRPTASRIKEAVFSMLFNDVIDSKVLDLFAGAGNLGIEALSGGATTCDFYDSNNEAIKIIKKNLDKLKVTDCKVEKADYLVVLNNAIKNKIQYDLIFLDPPYHLHIIDDLVKKIIDNQIVSENGIIVCEYGIDESTMDEYKDFEKYKDKKYGKTKITMFRRRY